MAQRQFDSRRTNFWTIQKATEPIDGFSGFPHEKVMSVFRRYRDLVEFSIQRDGDELILHVWGAAPALKHIRRDLKADGIESQLDSGADPKHLSVSWC